MRSLLLFLTSILMLIHCSTPTLTKEIKLLDNTTIERKENLISSLMKRHPTSPAIKEDTLAYIIYNGPKQEMAVAGDFNEWNPNKGKMIHVEGTEFWYLPLVFDRSANVQYKLVSDNSDWFLDPRNPLQSISDTDNSVIQMPDYQPEVETQLIQGIPHGQLSEFHLDSKYLNTERKFKIYYPANYELSKNKYPLLLVNDGYAYLEYGRMKNVLDNLIHQNKIPPVIAVFLPPEKRTEEYAEGLQNQFKSFVIEELYPWLKTNMRISEVEGTGIVIGSSYGGTISLSIAIEAPQIFGKVGAFSGYVSDDILAQFSSSVKMPISIYVNHGTYDHLKPIDESLGKFKVILDDKDYEYKYEEYPEAHHYEFWRAHLDDALGYLLKI